MYTSKRYIVKWTQLHPILANEIKHCTMQPSHEFHAIDCRLCLYYVFPARSKYQRGVTCVENRYSAINTACSIHQKIWPSFIVKSLKKCEDFLRKCLRVCTRREARACVYVRVRVCAHTRSYPYVVYLCHWSRNKWFMHWDCKRNMTIRQKLSTKICPPLLPNADKKLPFPLFWNKYRKYWTELCEIDWNNKKLKHKKFQTEILSLKEMQTKLKMGGKKWQPS